MGCYTSQNTGRLSQLASSLQIALGENTADQVMSKVYSKQFEQEFGAFALPEQMNPLEVQETLTSLRAEYETLTNELTDLAEDSDVDKEVDLRYQLEQVSTVIHDLETISQGKYSPIPLDAELEPDFNWVMQNVVHPDLVKLSERAREGKVFTNGQEKAFLDFYTRWKALSDEGFRVPSGMALARYEQMVQLFGTDQVTIPKELGEGLSVISVKKPRFVPNKQMAFEDFLPVTEQVTEVFNTNPELASVGTLEQYSQYLDTIFLDSKVRDIVYHGADEKIESFTLDKKKNKEEKGLFFFGKKQSAQLWRDASFEETNTQQGDLIYALLNITNPETIDFEDKSAWDMAKYANESIKGDGLIATNVDEMWVGRDTQYVVFEPKQIHILGSRQDIDGFKKFVAAKAFEDFSPEPSKFSYKGVQIDVPFTLSQDQTKVLEQLIDYVEDFTPGKVVTIEGAAGTGKTTIIGLLSTYLGKKGTVAYMAPTHAATAQLALATAKIGNKNLPNTVASGIAPKIGADGKQLVVNGVEQLVLAKKTTGQFKGLGDKILVVDESSMLDTATYEKIKNAAKNSEVTIIFMGDRGQLPSPKSKLVSPVFFENEVLTLTTVHRQKDSRLAVFLSKLRNKTQFTPLKVVGLEGVEFHSGLSSFDKAFVRLVEQDPEDTIWIGDTNVSVSAQNKKIRDHFGREGALQIGDIVMGYLGYESKQLTDPNNDFGNSANSIMYTIESIKNNQGSAEITLRSKTLDTLLEAGFNVNQKAKTKYVQLSTNDALEVDGATAETMSMWNASLSTLFEAYVKAVNNKNWHVKKLIEGELGEQFKKYDLGGDYIYDPALDKLVPYNKTNPSQDHKALVKKYGSNIFVEKGLDFGHAITAFKSQGISVKNVFVDAGTIRKVEDEVLTDKAGTPVTTVKQALLYVMMSRAKENLHVHEGNHVFEEVSLASLTIPPPPPVGQGKQPAGSTITPADFIDNTGGANGYDTEWDLIGTEEGFTNHVHHLLPSDGDVASQQLRAKGVKPKDATQDVGDVALTGPATGEGQRMITAAERKMGRIDPTHTTRNTKKIRNWAQVKNSEGVFAVGSLIPKGSTITLSKGTATKTALVPQVNGGTSGAVQMAIDAGKKVFVFNQETNNIYPVGWYTWDATKNDFVSTDIPVLTQTFAGVGTSSNTTEIGRQAIRNVYQKTKQALADGTYKVESGNKVEDSTNIILRSDVQKTPTTLYLFGDNDIRKGLRGQAKEMRREPNTIGISTKKLPANTPEAFKTDSELEENKRIITQDIDRAISEWNTGKYTKAVIPPIGIGLAKLQEKAPLTWAHLQTELQRFRDIVKGQQSEQVVEGTYETLSFVTEAEKLSPIKRQEIPQGYEATARAMFINRVVEVARENPNTILDLSEYFKNPSSFKGFDAFGLRMSEWVEIIDGIRIELKDSFPSNIKFNTAFRDALNNSTRRLIQGLSNRVSLETRTRLGFTINQAKKAKVAARVDILTSTPDGGVSVPFSAKHGIEKQQAMHDCISAMFYFLYEKGNGQIKIPHLIGTILMEVKNMASKDGPDKALFQDTVQAFAFSTQENKRSFLDDLLDTLDYMGYRIDKAGRDGLKNVFAAAKSDPTFVPNGDIIQVNTETFRDVDSEMDDALDDAIDQLNADETRLGVMRDWQDSSFEKNSKDQASARLKMLIAQQAKYEEFSYGVVAKAEDADINLDTLFPGVLIQDYTQGQLRQLQGKKVYSSYGEDYTRRQLQSKAVILQAKPIITGIPPLVQFDSVYEKIIGVLSDKPMLTFSKAMELLKTSGNADLYRIAMVLEKLGADPKKAHLQKEFMRVVQLQYTQYLVVRTNAKKGKEGKYTQTKVINAQRNDQAKVIVGRWQTKQKLSPVMTTRDTGERVLNMNVTRDHARVIDILGMMAKRDLGDISLFPQMMNAIANSTEGVKALFSTIDVAKLLSEEYNNVADKQLQRTQLKVIMKRLFADHGVELKDGVLDSMFSYTYQRGENGPASRKNRLTAYFKTGKSSFSQDFREQFSLTTDGKPAGMFSAFFRKAAGLHKDIDLDDSVSEDMEDLVTLDNPLYTETTTTLILGKFAAEQEDNLYNAGHTTIEGKQNYDYTLQTTLSQLTTDLFQGLTSFRKNLTESIWGDNPYLVMEGSKNIQLRYMEGLNANDASSGVKRTKMSDREQLMTALSMFTNNNKQTTNIMSLTHSDKTTTPVFENIPRLKVHNADGSFNDDVLNMFVTMLAGEHRRIVKVQSLLKTQGTTGYKNMDKSGTKFFFFPFMNIEKLTQDNVRSMFYDSEGNLLETIEGDAVSYFKKELVKFLKASSAKAVQYALKSGVKSEFIDHSYLKRFKETKGEHLELTMQDYTVQSMLWNMSATVMLLGDPANAEWKGSIKATLQEFAKRLAKDIAPASKGDYPGQLFSSLTLDDVEMFYDYVVESGGTIDGSRKSSDAQELTTVQEFLDNLYHGQGKITKELYDELQRKVSLFDTENEEKFTDEELTALGSPMQPQKPIYAGPFFAHSLGMYNYIKTSAYPLFPWLTRGKEIDKLRLLMEGKLVDGYATRRAVFVSGSKLGTQTNPVKVFSPENKFITPNIADLQQNTRLLERRYFGIQQEVPFDEEKEEIYVVTQMDKLIVGGILGMHNFEVFGKKISGKELRAAKEQVRVALSKFNVDKLLKSLGVSSASEVIKPAKVIQLILDTARAGEYSPNDIAILEDVLTAEIDGKEITESTIPVYFQSAMNSFEKLLMAKVKKSIQIKLPGRSYVQGASVGFLEDLNSTLQKGITMVPGRSLSEPLRIQRIENGVVKPAEVIAPFNFVVNGKRLKITDFMKEGTNELDMERVPQELLQQVCARIPNQGHNSMMAVEVVGFTPEWLGDLMLVPSAITEQMGSDFDVDKLFAYQRPYTTIQQNGKTHLVPYRETATQLGATPADYEDLNKLATSYLEALGVPTDEEGRYDSKEWKRAFTKAVAEKYPDGNVPRHETGTVNEENLKAKYFELHWAVLTHPEVYPLIATKLDKPDLGFKAEDGANKLFAKESEENDDFFAPVTQLKQFQSGKDAKALVGMTSLSVVSNANWQDKKLQYGTYQKEADGSYTEVPMFLELNGLKLSHISGESISERKGYSKHTNITIDQSGAVDNAKDRTLDNLNITMATYAAFEAMNQMHEDANGKQTSLNKQFMTALSVQDILWEYTDETRKVNDQYSEEYTIEAAEFVANKLREKYSKLAKENGIEEDNLGKIVADTAVTYDMLVKAFNESKVEKKSGLYYARQLAVLNKFMEARRIGERLRVLRKTFNQDTSGPGPNLLYVMQQLSNYESIMAENEGKILIGEASIAQGQPGQLFQMSVPIAKSLLSSIMPTTSLETLTAQVALMSGKTASTLSTKTQQKVQKSLKAAMLSSLPMLASDITAARARLLYSTNNEESLAIRIERAKETVKNNTFLDRLSSNLAPIGSGPDFVEFLNQKVKRLVDLRLIQDFDRLMSDPETTELAKDLLTYSYLMQSEKGYQSKIPAGLILGTNLASNIRLRYKDFSTGNIPDTMLDQIVQHNPMLAPEAMKGFLEKNTSPEIEGKDYRPIILLNVLENGTSVPEVTAMKIANGHFPAFIRLRSELENKTILYKLRLQTDASVEYVQVDTLGKAGTVEYNLNAVEMHRSIFKENRSSVEFEEPSAKQMTDALVEDATAKIHDPKVPGSKWGMQTQMDAVDFASALSQIGVDKTIPAYLRTLSTTLSVWNEAVPRTFLHGMPAFKATMGTVSSYISVTNTLSLNSTSNPTDLARAAIHETIHHRTAQMLTALGWRPRAHFEKAWDAENLSAEEKDRRWNLYLEKSAKNSSKYPEVYAKIVELDKLRAKAYNEFKARLIAEGKDPKAVLDSISTGVNEENLLAYSMDNLIEFVTMSLTDQNLIQFLNTVEGTGQQSWFSKLKDAVLNFISDVISMLGNSYNDKSILKDCLALSYELTTLEDMNPSVTATGLEASLAMYSTEQQASAMQNSLEAAYKNRTKLDDKGTHFQLEVFSDLLPSTHIPYIEKALINLGAQLEVFNSILSNIQANDPLAKQKRAEVAVLRTQVKKDYEELSRNLEAESMLKIANEQLKWVTDLFNSRSAKKQPLTPAEARIAREIVMTWKSLEDAHKFFTDGVDSKIAEVTALAFKLLDNLKSQEKKSFIADANEKTGIKVSVEEIGGLLKNIRSDQMYTIALERDTQKISQVISIFTQTQIQNAQEQKINLNKDLRRLKELSIKNPGLYQALMQETEDNTVWGLVQNLDPTWFQNLAAAKSALAWRTKGANAAREPIARERKIKQAYEEYWKEMTKNGTVLPVEKLINFETGELLSTAQAVIDELKLKHVPENVDTAVKEAIEYYAEFLERKEVKRLSMAAEAMKEVITETNKTPYVLTAVEQAEVDAEIDVNKKRDKTLSFIKKYQDSLVTLRIAPKLQEWVVENSILEFSNTSPKNTPTVDFLQNRSNTKNWVIPFNNEANIDPKYVAIQENADHKEAYEILTKWSSKLREYIPLTHSRKMHDNWLPAIDVDETMAMASELDKLKEKGTGRYLLEKVSVSEWDMSRKNSDEIPLKYLGGPVRKQDTENPNEIDFDATSQDLARVFEMFGNMAIDYHYMYPANELIVTAQRLISEENTERGGGLENTLAMVKYYRDMLVLKNPKKVEAVSSDPIYSAKPSEHKELKKRVSEINKELKELELRIVDEESEMSMKTGLLFYSLDEDHELVQERRELEDELNEIRKKARYLAGSKAADALIAVQQLKSLSYNPISAVSNLTFGYLSARMHGRGFRANEQGFTSGDYTDAQLTAALKLMKGTIPASWFKFSGMTGGEMAEKCRALIHRTNAIEAMIDTNYGQSNLGEEKSNLKKYFDPFAAQKSGDFLMKGAVIIARALNTPVEVNVNGEVATVNLFEALNKDGQWDEETYGTNKEWSSDTPEEQTKWNKYLLRTRKTLVLVFGNQDKNMPQYLRNFAVGRLLGQFRLSWIPEGIKTRWGGMQEYDEVLERKVEGRYRTMFRLKNYGFTLLLKQAASAFSGKDPFADERVEFTNAEGDIEERGMEEFEIENMRRNLAGLSYSALILAMYYVLKASLPDEDELRKRRRRGQDDTHIQRFAINMLYRMHQDLAMYTSPELFQQLVGNPVPSWGVIGDVLKAGKAWGKFATDEDYKAKQVFLATTRMFPFLNNINKINTYTTKDLSTAVR